jgi:hypothetical protein
MYSSQEMDAIRVKMNEPPYDEDRCGKISSQEIK